MRSTKINLKILALCGFGFSILGTGSAMAEQAMLAPFSPTLAVVGSPLQLQQFKEFTILVGEHLNLFSHLPNQQSSALKVVLLPSPTEPGGDPAFLLDTKVLLMGPLAQCQNSESVNFNSVNLHEFAHSVFAPNFYKALHLTGEVPPAERYDAANARNNPDFELTKRSAPRDLAAPFDEVFADAFAVLAMNDPKAVQIPLTACGTYDVLRDFSAQYSPLGWDEGTLKPISFILSSGNFYDKSGSQTQPQALFIDAKVHNILSPFRSVIWSELFCLRSKKIPDSEAVILAATFNASIKVIQQLYAKNLNFGQWFEISKEELNQNVIGEFKDLLRDL